MAVKLRKKKNTVAEQLGARAKKIRNSRLAGVTAKQVLDATAQMKETGIDPSSVSVILRKAVFDHSAPKTTKELYDYIVAVYGVHIPYKAASPEHNAPFEAIASIYFRRHSRILVMGPRNSGKTLNLAIVSNVTAKHVGGSQWVHAAALKSQAAVVGAYLENFRKDPVHGQNFTHETYKSQVSYKNGSRWYLVSGTATGLNSHHPEVLSLDEIEWWPSNAIDQAWAVPTQRNGWLDLLAAASTRQRSYGLMSYLWNNAKDLNIKQFSWTIFECMKPCRTCVALDEHPHGTDEQRNKSCPLWEDCLGVLGRNCAGFIPRSKVIENKMNRKDIWDAQYMCRTPPSTGLVFYNFDTSPAIMDSSGVFLGGGNIWAWEYTPALPYEVWFDPAEGKTAVFYFVQKDPRYGYLFVFDMLVIYNCAHDEIAKSKLYDYIVTRKYGLAMPKEVVVDPHKPETRKLFADGDPIATMGSRHKFNAVAPRMPRGSGGAGRNEEIKVTIPLLHSYILDGRNRRHLFFHPRCKDGYAKGITQHNYPIDKNSGEVRVDSNPVPDASKDFVDPLRYGVVYDAARGGGPKADSQKNAIYEKMKELDRRRS